MPFELPELPSEPGRILIVDDDDNIRRVLVEILASAGHEVIEAKDGVDALEIAQRELPDALMLDVLMPGIDGFYVCQRLKADERTAHIPILMMTGLNDSETRLKGIQAGANDFLGKPGDAQEVLLRVRNVVREKKLVDELRRKNEELRRLADPT